MTRSLQLAIGNALNAIYGFFTTFWSTFGSWLQVVSVIQDIVTESIWLSYYLAYEWYLFIQWWAYQRTDATFLSDFYNTFFFLRLGFEDYVLLRGDPENIGRVVFYPANFAYHILLVLENITYTLDTFYRNVVKAINNLLTWDVVKSAILTWLPNLENIATWWSDWWTSIKEKIVEWWGLSDNPIRLAIATATKGLSDLLTAWSDFWDTTWQAWTKSFDTLATAWDTFFTDTLPTLLDVNWALEWWQTKLAEIGELLLTKRNEWFPNYDLEASQEPDRISFFTSPLDWLVGQFEAWFWEE